MARAKGDYAAKRADVAAATWRVIGREGLAGASMRRIAAELESTTGILSHYFRDKDELIMFAMEEFYDRLLKEMVAAAGQAGDPVARLEAAVTEPLPLDAEREEGWRILFAFMSHSQGRGKLRKRYQELYRTLIELMASLIRDVQQAGRIPADRDPVGEAHKLVAIVDGVGFSVLLYPDGLPRDRLRPTVIEYIEKVMLDPASGG